MAPAFLVSTEDAVSNPEGRTFSLISRPVTQAPAQSFQSSSFHADWKHFPASVSQRNQLTAETATVLVMWDPSHTEPPTQLSAGKIMSGEEMSLSIKLRKFEIFLLLFLIPTAYKRDPPPAYFSQFSFFFGSVCSSLCQIIHLAFQKITIFFLTIQSLNHHIWHV